MHEHPTSPRPQHPACWGVDPELFFGPADSPEGEPARDWERRALSVCAGCPVVAACLTEALTFPARDQHGVTGGTTAAQRRALLRAPHRRELPEDVDELVIGQLVTGGPVVGAPRPEELAHAAVRLHQAGHRPGSIAKRLRVGDRQVHRWLARHRAGTPLVPPRGGHRTTTPPQRGTLNVEAGVA
ncbi:MAG: WhiB family transcriptional regulator [Pseudonocardiaceae bacterium]